MNAAAVGLLVATAVPQLTRWPDIKLNERLSLRAAAEPLASNDETQIEHNHLRHNRFDLLGGMAVAFLTSSAEIVLKRYVSLLRHTLVVSARGQNFGLAIISDFGLASTQARY